MLNQTQMMRIQTVKYDVPSLPHPDNITIPLNTVSISITIKPPITEYWNASIFYNEKENLDIFFLQ